METLSPRLRPFESLNWSPGFPLFSPFGDRNGPPIDLILSLITLVLVLLVRSLILQEMRLVLSLHRIRNKPVIRRHRGLSVATGYCHLSAWCRLAMFAMGIMHPQLDVSLRPGKLSRNQRRIAAVYIYRGGLQRLSYLISNASLRDLLVE